MPRESRAITPEDILPMQAYAAIRGDKRAENIVRKQHRRITVGPHVTVLFESWDTMWLQVHEMLRAEKGGAGQIPDELAAYNPMIPNGSELTCTLMFEIDDPGVRARVLGQLGGIEDHIYLSIDGAKAPAVAEDDVERTNEAGKTSSVHFLHFPFTASQITAVRQPGSVVMFHIAHPNYGHIAILNEDMRAELARDFD